MEQLTCAAVAGKIAAHLRGELGAAALARWAEDQSYRYEMDELDYEDDELIDSALEDLTFGDMPGAALDEAALREWQQLLAPPDQEQDAP